MSFTALNHWTILLLDITHWLANSTRELYTKASAIQIKQLLIIKDDGDDERLHHVTKCIYETPRGHQSSKAVWLSSVDRCVCSPTFPCVLDGASARKRPKWLKCTSGR